VSTGSRRAAGNSPTVVLTGSARSVLKQGLRTLTCGPECHSRTAGSKWFEPDSIFKFKRVQIVSNFACSNKDLPEP
jgi:hypothetical protein